MQNCKKYGVAVAVASVATGAMAQKVSSVNSGDAAIVPYYTAEGGRITGVHIVNTTASTQAVKVRLRRGSDSADAMDFNVVMSPKDEWTAYVGKDENGVFVGTSDTTCTVPKSLAETGKGYMPTTFADGASEGYIEIIGMGQAVSEKDPVPVGAKHAKGTPADCATVEKNFLRVSDAYRYDSSLASTTQTTAAGKSKQVGGAAGVHTNALTSTGTCAAVSTTVTACRGVATAIATNTTAWTDTSDQALKVSYFIREGATEGEGGLEVGDNAVHIEGFSDAWAGAATGAPLMTNQERQIFDANSTPPNRLLWDPQSFEFPNLGMGLGNTDSAISSKSASDLATANQNHFDTIRKILSVDQVVNEWADNANADADWIVTLPGQYAMRDSVCQRYAVEGPKTACVQNATALVAGNKLTLDDDQLPIYLVDGSGAAVPGVYAFSVTDREELPLTTTSSTASGVIDFSPSSNETEGYETVVLRREVNVVAWGEDDGTSVGSAAKQSATADTHGLVQVIGTGDLTEGWATLDIVPMNTDPDAAMMGTTSLTAGDEMNLAGAYTAVAAGVGNPAVGGQSQYMSWYDADPLQTPVVGLAVWKREFSDNAAANYGRAIEHSYAQSSGSCGYNNAGTDVNGSSAC